MVGNGRGSHEEQNPTGGVTQNRRKSRRSKVKQSRVSSFDRRRSGSFSAVRMAGERRSASKLQIGTKLGQNSGRKREIPNFHLTWEHSSLQFYRVHGTKIAKIPLVGTREKFRSGDYKGTMMLKLFAQIESVSAGAEATNNQLRQRRYANLILQALRMLNVENLVIPSVPELVPMWINKYGFTHIESNLMTELIKYNTLMFPSAVRLHKSLVTHAAASAATKSDEANKNGTGLVRGKGYEKLAFFDLNLEPPKEDDDA
ncbi:hypothetical protein KPL70_006290 [Citrus sinensis]|nr:hypothetical protein KPL70_006290 [Citrus sinensis]